MCQNCYQMNMFSPSFHPPASVMFLLLFDIVVPNRTRLINVNQSIFFDERTPQITVHSTRNHEPNQPYFTQIQSVINNWFKYKSFQHFSIFHCHYLKLWLFTNILIKILEKFKRKKLKSNSLISRVNFIFQKSDRKINQSERSFQSFT